MLSTKISDGPLDLTDKVLLLAEVFGVEVFLFARAHFLHIFHLKESSQSELLCILLVLEFQYDVFFAFAFIFTDHLVDLAAHIRLEKVSKERKLFKAVLFEFRHR